MFNDEIERPEEDEDLTPLTEEERQQALAVARATLAKLDEEERASIAEAINNQ